MAVDQSYYQKVVGGLNLRDHPEADCMALGFRQRVSIS